VTESTRSCNKVRRE